MNYLKSINKTYNRHSIQSSHINIDYVQRKHASRLKTRLEIFEKILQRVYNRIDIASDNQQRACFYTIPEYLYGLPTYNIKMCAAYLIKNLLANGFRVKFYRPNIIYVYWHFHDDLHYYIMPSQPSKKLLTAKPPVFPDEIALSNDELKQISLKTNMGRAVPIPLPPINRPINLEEDVRECDSEENMLISPPSICPYSPADSYKDFTISLTDPPKKKKPINKNNIRNIY